MATMGAGGHSRIRVLVADDHALIREGTRATLQGAGGIEVVGSAGDGETALSLARALRPDVVLLDVRLPDISGIEVAERLRAELPATGILVLTGYEDVSYYRAFIKLGVQGYLRKTTSAAEVVAAVRAIASGGTAIEPLDQPAGVNGREALSPRELDVLSLLVEGCRNREIAERLEVSLKTIEFHVSNILQKLGARSRAEVAVLAVESGITVPRPNP
ncbi:MAG: response regulator transcription factor [Chloroflexi bacterium]|nr:response regulator transcription factor [Chloroflexota bacterium]MCL5111237.1 response regulator transcription factor [Chloroflexota bacterium]